MTNTMFAVAVLMAVAIAVSHAGVVPPKYPVPVPIRPKDSAVVPVDAYSVIEAETLYSDSGLMVGQWANFEAIYEIGNGDYAYYRQVNFGSGPTMVSVNYASWDLTVGQTAQIQWVLDSPYAIPFHTTTVGFTGTESYYNRLVALEVLQHCPEVTGVHDLYLRFAVDQPSNDMVMLIDWFQFHQFS